MDALGIVSDNIDRAKNFYGCLGLDFKQVGGPDHYEAIGPNNVRIMLDSVDLIKKIYPSWKRALNQNVAICFKQMQSQDVDLVYKKLLENKGRPLREPWDAFWGQRYASVLDPDGNQIDLFAQL